jgi:exodeoxyribonuclease V alpha subunit
MNRGGVGARSLNIELQAALNPAGDRKVERFGWTFAPGGVGGNQHVELAEPVGNGPAIKSSNDLAGGGIDAIDIADVAVVDLFVVVVLDLHDLVTKARARNIPPWSHGVLRHDWDVRRNLLYTGITRGKRLVVLVGQRKAVAIAVRNISGRQRWSKLQEWLGSDPAPLR